MSKDRRLAAIMFTDIVGYTKLMGTNEKKAFEILRINRLLQKPTIKKHKGKWLKEMGDGILASFDTASDAVNCAITIQNLAKLKNIDLRIGIHLGEVIYEASDVFGDGVNIASRLEALADSGCIYVSGPIYKIIKNQQGFIANFIEEVSLKNVDEPVRIYSVESKENAFDETTLKRYTENPRKKLILFFTAVLAILIIGGLMWWKIPEQKPAVSEKSIAVLPFINDSPYEENEYFCNGMMDEILNHLQNISELGVKSRTAVEPYRNNPKSFDQVARELKVSYILEGSVRKYGDRFRITTQLIDVGSGNHIWAETYDGIFSDTIFLVQGNIAKKVASSLNAVILPDEKERIEHVPTTKIEAYDYYIRGRYETINYWKTGEKKHLVNAHEHLDKALQIDPEFLLAIVQKGNVFIEEKNYDSTLACARKAILLNPDYNRGYGLLGEYYVFIGKSDLAIEQYQKAIKLPPWDESWLWYHAALGRLYLNQKNDVVNALTYLQKALELNNELLSDVYPLIIGSFITVGDYNQAEAYIHKSLDLEVSCTVVLYYCWIRELQGRFEEASEILDLYCQESACVQLCLRERFQVSLLSGDYTNAEQYFNQWKESGPHWRTSDLYVHYQIGYVYDKMGKQDMAEAVFDKQIKNLESSLDTYPAWIHPNYMNLSRIYAYQGDRENALKFLRKYAERGFTYGWHDFILQDPFFEKLRNDPDFEAIVQQAQESTAILREELHKMKTTGKINL